MDFKNERLMMSEEEARNRAKELFNENQVDLIIKYMFLEQQCKKQKEIINKTINAIDLVIELIKQQPTKDDRWILDRLNGFKIILEDKEVSE